MFLLRPHGKILTFVKQVWSEQRKLTCTELDRVGHFSGIVDTFKATAGHLFKIIGILVKPKHLPCKFISVVCENILGLRCMTVINSNISANKNHRTFNVSPSISSSCHISSVTVLEIKGTF